MAVFSIDGKSYRVLVKSLKRTFQVLDGENTGRTNDGDMFRDVIGTFYNYAVEVDTKILAQGEYDELYEVISAPKAFHDFVMPYGQEVYSYQGYITTGGDTLERMDHNGKRWNGLSFNMVAKSPKRRPA